MSTSNESMRTAADPAYVPVVAAIPPNTELDLRPLLSFLHYLWHYPEAERIFKDLQEIDPELRFIYVQTVAQSRSEITALDPTHENLDANRWSPANAAPEATMEGTLAPHTASEVGIVCEPPFPPASPLTQDISFPAYMCRGCPYGHCEKEYRYFGSWKKHFEQKHLSAYWKMSGQLICPHCAKSFPTDSDIFQTHLWVHMKNE